VPVISASFQIFNDLSWSANVNQRPLKPSNLSLVPTNVSTLSSVLNALAAIKSLRDDDASLSWVKAASEIIKMAAEKTDSVATNSKLNFLNEQVCFLSQSDKQKRFSPSLMTFCFSLFSSSRSAYEILRDQHVLSTRQYEVPQSQLPATQTSMLFFTLLVHYVILKLVCENVPLAQQYW